MGKDGAVAMKELRDAGAYNFAQAVPRRVRPAQCKGIAADLLIVANFSRLAAIA